MNSPHRVPRQPIPDAVLVDGNNSLVVDAPQDLKFAPRLMDRCLRCGADRLDGNFVARFDVHATVDNAHAAVPEHAGDSVALDERTGGPKMCPPLGGQVGIGLPTAGFIGGLGFA